MRIFCLLLIFLFFLWKCPILTKFKNSSNSTDTKKQQISYDFGTITHKRQIRADNGDYSYSDYDIDELPAGSSNQPPRLRFRPRRERVEFDFEEEPGPSNRPHRIRMVPRPRSVQPANPQHQVAPPQPSINQLRTGKQWLRGGGPISPLLEQLLEENDLSGLPGEVWRSEPRRVSPNQMHQFLRRGAPPGGWQPPGAWQPPPGLARPKPVHSRSLASTFKSKFRSYQKALSEYENNQSIRPKFNSKRARSWNDLLLARHRGPFGFRPLPRRANPNQRRASDPDIHLDWVPNEETLEQARQRLNYLNPPTRKKPEPKGYPRRPTYYEAVYKSNEGNDYYSTLSRMQKLSVQRDRVKEAYGRVKHSFKKGFDRFADAYISFLYPESPSRARVQQRRADRQLARQAPTVPSPPANPGRERPPSRSRSLPRWWRNRRGGSGSSAGSRSNSNSRRMG